MKSIRKNFVPLCLCGLFLALTFFTGCTGGSKTSTDVNSLAADINNLAATASEVSATTDQLQVIAGQVVEALQAAGAGDSNTAGTVAHISVQVDRVQTIFDNVVAALKANNIVASADNIQAVLTLAQQINTATAAVNPYAIYISIGLTLLGILYGIWQKMQAGKATTTATTATTALTQVVTGIEDFKDSANASVNPDLKSALALLKVKQAEIQSPKTAGLVAEIKATV